MIDHPTLEPVELTAAAARLGISREALRTKIRRNQQPGAAKAEGRWVVLLPAEDGDAISDTSGASDFSTSREVAKQEVRLVEPQQSQVLTLESQVTWYQGALERRDAEAARLRELLADALALLARERAPCPWWRRALGRA